MNQKRTYFKELPEGYYLEHFEKVRGFYLNNYGEDFSPRIKQFLSQFDELDVYEKRLVIRLSNLKSNFHRPDKIKYTDIPNTKEIGNSLLDKGFIKKIEINEKLDLIESLNKLELQSLLDFSQTEFKKSWNKEKLLDLAMRQSESSIVMWANDSFFVEAYTFELEFLRFLFFGKYSRDLSLFSLRDLGIRKTSEFQVTEEIFFDKLSVAVEEFSFAKRYKDLSKKSDSWINHTYLQNSSYEAPEVDFYRAGEYFNAFLMKLVKLSSLDEEKAISILKHATAAPARMKLARLLFKNERHQQSKEILDAIRDSPSSDEELLEANDFIAIKFGSKKTTALTSILADAEVLHLDDSYRSRVEAGVINHFTDGKREVFFAENNLWLTLFSILFWEEIFSSMNNEFERIPRTLQTGEFWQAHESSIKHKVENLFSSKSRIKILKTFTENYGKRNGIFRWRKSSIEKINLILDTKSPEVQSLLLAMANDYLAFRNGFPDLVMIESSVIKFIEVKGEADVIRRNQLAVLLRLEKLGFDVSVLKVEYIFDPNQTYVVVDVETTGGRAANHKVIEIGAVKIKGDQVIGEYSTLIDPQRPIPPFITKLTGITNKCVEGAPVFEDIAEEFMSFCEGSVFAAHNVNFDYGFIREEFLRIGKRFRLAKFCTCARARHYLKGPKSYSLANICDYFEIDLKSHHRALCDAKAASEILFLINEKRNRNLSGAA